MTTKNLFLFILLLFGYHFYAEAQQTSPVKIPFEAGLNTEKELLLSHIAAEVKIILWKLMKIVCFRK